MIAVLLCVWAAQAYDFEKDGLFYNITDRLRRTVEVTHWEVMTGANGVPTRPHPDRCLAHMHDSTHVHGPHCHHVEEGEKPVAPKFPDTVVIPEKVWYRGIRYKVTAIGDGSFFARENIRVVRLPRTIKRIGRSAFSRCGLLCEIDFPDGIDTIAEHAFYMNSTIERPVLPKGLKYLDSYAFALCNQLKEVFMPEGLCSFRANAFVHCRNLKRIVLYQKTPPRVETTGVRVDFRNIVFEVPEESLPAYQVDKFWRDRTLVPF